MYKKYGNTPLHLASRCSNALEIVRELAQLYSAALGAQNGGEGDTPLHLAANAKYPDSLELVRELISSYPAALEMTDGDNE